MKTLLGKSEPSLDGAFEDLEPLNSRYASAEAAIDNAIRQRNGAGAEPDRRNPMLPDRRAADGVPALANTADRRGPVVDRRTAPQGFGRRNRPAG